MQTTASDIASIRSIYREFLQHLRLIPDSEIRCYYYKRCRTIADAATEGAQYKPIPEVPDAPSRDPSRLLSKLQRELTAIKEVAKGDHTKYQRMIDMTYARRGKRRWDFLDTIYPPSLQRPPPDPSSSLSRRSQPPSPYPAHIAALVPTKKALDNEPRASLKLPTPRVIANRLWEERSTEMSKMTIPLAVRMSSWSSSRNPVKLEPRKGKQSQAEMKQRPLNRDEIAVFTAGLTKNEERRLRDWFRIADRMTESLERLKSLQSYPLPVRISQLGRLLPTKAEWSAPKEERTRPTSRPTSLQLKIPLRTIRRLYERFVGELPVLVGTYHDAALTKNKQPDGKLENIGSSTIRWRSIASKKTVAKMSIMSPEEAEWVI